MNSIQLSSQLAEIYCIWFACLLSPFFAFWVWFQRLLIHTLHVIFILCIEPSKLECVEGCYMKSFSQRCVFCPVASSFSYLRVLCYRNYENKNKPECQANLSFVLVSVTCKQWTTTCWASGPILTKTIEMTPNENTLYCGKLNLSFIYNFWRLSHTRERQVWEEECCELCGSDFMYVEEKQQKM